MFTLGGFLLGIINIAIVAAIMVLVGLAIEWMVGLFGKPLPGEMRKFYLILIMLVCLYMLVALLLGLPTLRIIGSVGADRILETVAAGSTLPRAVLII